MWILIVFLASIFPPAIALQLVCKFLKNFELSLQTWHFIFLSILPRLQFTVNVRPPFLFETQWVQWNFILINIFPLKWSMTLSINIFTMSCISRWIIWYCTYYMSQVFIQVVLQLFLIQLVRMLEFIGAVVYWMIATKVNTHQYMMQYIYYNTSSSTYLNRYEVTMQLIPTCWLSYDTFSVSLPSTLPLKLGAILGSLRSVLLLHLVVPLLIYWQSFLL